MDLPALVAKEAPTLYRPDSLRWHEVDGDTSYTAVSSPSRWAAIPLLGFAAVWDGILAVWYSIGFGALFSGGGGEAALMLLFPLVHLGAGIFITHKGLVTLFNKRTIHVNASEFRFERIDDIRDGSDLRIQCDSPCTHRDEFRRCHPRIR